MTSLTNHLQPLHEATIKAVREYEAIDKRLEAKNLLWGFCIHHQGMMAVEKQIEEFRKEVRKTTKQLKKHLEEFNKVWRR